MLILKRWLAAVILMVWMMFSVGGAQAQDDCGLSAEDCALLERSNEVMAGVQAAAFDLSTDLTMNYFLLPEPLVMRMTMGGIFTVGDFRASDPTLQLVEGLNADANLILRLEDFVQDDPLFAGMDTTLAMDFRLVDGFGYANFDKAEGAGLPVGWYGMDLAGMYQAILEATPTLESLAPTEPVQTFPAVSEAATFARVDDTTIAGHTTAVFESMLNLADALENPTARRELEDLMFTTIEAQFFGLYSDEEIQQASEGYAEVLGGVSFSVRQYISPEDGYLRRLEFVLDFQPESEALMALNTMPDPFNLASVFFDIRIDFALNISRFEDVPLVRAPEDATIVPLEDILGTLLPGSSDF